LVDKIIFKISYYVYSTVKVTKLFSNFTTGVNSRFSVTSGPILGFVDPQRGELSDPSRKSEERAGKWFNEISMVH